MFTRYKKIALFSLIVLVHLAFSYYYFQGWWYSMLGSILIVFLGWLRWKDEFLPMLGVKLNGRTIFKTAVLVAVITAFSFLIMKWIGSSKNIEIETGTWQNYFHDVFYILNEEMVLGAIALFSLKRSTKFSPLVISLGFAVIFSLVHFVFYKWIFLDRGTLQFTALITLLLVGFTRNNLIFATGHIGYSWALHFGWMVVMFGCNHHILNSDKYLGELDRFNLYLGSVEMLTVGLILAGASLVFLRRRERDLKM